jgi:hypothetical protein
MLETASPYVAAPVAKVSPKLVAGGAVAIGSNNSPYKKCIAKLKAALDKAGDEYTLWQEGILNLTGFF